jgi:hypothetical protein
MFDLTKISFEDLVSQLIYILRTKDAWKDANLQSTGRMLIELYAYVAQLLLYYLKRSYEEMFIDSAQYWESLCRLANMFEAHVKRPVGASGQVKLVLRRASSEPIIVSAKTPVLCGDVLFYIVNDVVFNPGETEKVVDISQGVWSERVFTSNGNQMRQDYRIAIENVSDVGVEVYVNDTAYAVVEYFGQTLDKLQAKVWTSPDKALNVTFLRGFGVPSLGSEVTIRYCEVRYDYYPPVDSIWSMPRDERFEVIPILSSFSRGAYWEDEDSFRERLQGWFGVGQRAATKEDFWHIVSGVEGVGKVQVVDVKDNFNAPFREVEVYITDPLGGVPSGEVVEKVRELLDKVGSVGVMYDLRPVQLVEVDVFVKAFVGRVYSTERAKVNIINAIKELYSDLEIQEWVNIDKIRRTVLSVDGVRTCEVILPGVDMELRKGQMVHLRSVRADVYVGV